MENEITLWLPEGFGKGTIIYDLNNEPYEAVRYSGAGANIYVVEKVDKKYALMRISQGANQLISK